MFYNELFIIVIINPDNSLAFKTWEVPAKKNQIHLNLMAKLRNTSLLRMDWVYFLYESTENGSIFRR